MGHQTQLHMLPDDVEAFLDFVQSRDPVIVTLWRAESPGVAPVTDPLAETQVMSLWNQDLIPLLQRSRNIHSTDENYGIDYSLPTIEFSPSVVCDWNSRPALVQGRIYGFFDKPNGEYEKWFTALATWIRRHFSRAPSGLNGYVGPAALNWFHEGGVLLPMFHPPLTPQWLSFVEKQHEGQATGAKRH